MYELKAEGQDEGQYTFEKCFPIAKQLEVRRFAPEIRPKPNTRVTSRKLSTQRSIREPLTLSPLQPDSGRRYAD